MPKASVTESPCCTHCLCHIGHETSVAQVAGGLRPEKIVETFLGQNAILGSGVFDEVGFGEREVLKRERERF